MDQATTTTTTTTTTPPAIQSDQQPSKNEPMHDSKQRGITIPPEEKCGQQSNCSAYHGDDPSKCTTGDNDKSILVKQPINKSPCHGALISSSIDRLMGKLQKRLEKSLEVHRGTEADRLTRVLIYDCICIRFHMASRNPNSASRSVYRLMGILLGRMIMDFEKPSHSLLYISEKFYNKLAREFRSLGYQNIPEWDQSEDKELDPSRQLCAMKK